MAEYTLYSCVTEDNVYVRLSGASDFLPYGQVSLAGLSFAGIAASVSGDIYLLEEAGYIWKKPAGSSSFIKDTDYINNWFGIGVSLNGDVYVSGSSGYGRDIFVKYDGTTEYVALNQTNRNWTGLCCDQYGNMYACVWGGSIYKKAVGSSDFVLYNSIIDYFIGITVTRSNNIYAVSYGTSGKVYKQTNLTGSFVDLSLGDKRYTGITCTPANVIYISATDHWDLTGDRIYVLDDTVLNLISFDGTVRKWYGITVVEESSVNVMLYINAFSSVVVSESINNSSAIDLSIQDVIVLSEDYSLVIYSGYGVSVADSINTQDIVELSNELLSIFSFDENSVTEIVTCYMHIDPNTLCINGSAAVRVVII